MKYYAKAIQTYINEDEMINNWLSKNTDIKITNIKESITPNGAYKITTIYYIKERAEKLKKLNQQTIN
jgi:hypothetical protein